MKFSEQWLREWVNPALSIEALCHQLTMSGLEVESVSPDKVIELSITPNRGDCLSMRGVAREVAALTSTRLQAPVTPIIPAVINDTLPITVQAKEACPRYVGRIIKRVKADAPTPSWLLKRLEECGLNSISVIVDIVNYVMLELGQPMHAFDLGKVDKEIRVRLSKNKEKIALLDGSEKELDAETLVIADHVKPLAIAGVMGGLASGVTTLTTDILLESAYFLPQIIAKQRQRYGLNSDSSYRFERGVDSAMQQEAIERATQLIIELAGGEPGPVMAVAQSRYLPKQKTITLTAAAIQSLLGIVIPAETITQLFETLGFPYKTSKGKWSVTVPSYRFDLVIPEDLIEEIARVYGYERIPTHVLAPEKRTAEDSRFDRIKELKKAFSHCGYHEIISYSFVDPNLQAQLNPGVASHALMNPMTAEMAVMRTNLWSGLINAFKYNASRQQTRIRLFELGTCFIGDREYSKVGGLASGFVSNPQWGMPQREMDFFDLKGTLENILSMSFAGCQFKPSAHAALHPGQTAEIYYQETYLGLMGALHPELLQALDLKENAYVFELNLEPLLVHKPVCTQPISKFPEIRRDLALLIKQTVPSAAIQDTIKGLVGDWLKDLFVFDVYQGKGIEPGYKSVALALILQHPTRTLIDEEVVALMDRVMAALNGQFGAELRS